MGHYLYTVVNKHNGKIITGSAKEIAKELGVAPAHVSKSLLEGHLIGGAWKISRVPVAVNKEMDIDAKFIADWNKACEPFRRLSRKKSERMRKDGNLANGN